MTTAQSSAGIKVYYGDATVGTGGVITAPTTWTEIPDITSLPALQGDPNMLDTTTLAETDSKTYTFGLDDNGGLLNYNIWFTSEAITAAAAAATAPTSGKRRAFKISFPAPLSKDYWYCGMAKPLLPGETEVDGVVATVLHTSMETAPTILTA